VAARSSRAGFTLIEVLLTLVIMAGIMLTVTQILSAARTSRDTIQNIQEQRLAGPAILDLVEADLRALTLFDRDARWVFRVQNRVLSGFEADAIDFVATTDGLVPFRARAGEDFRRADHNEVGYHLRPNPESDDFLELYRREDFGVDEQPFEGGEFSFLHDRVKGFEVRVYEEDGVEAEPLESWGDEGEEHVGLPARVELELTLELAPRLVREQLVGLRHTVTYKRTFRFAPSLVAAQESALVPLVPRLTTPVPEAPGAPASGTGGEDESGDESRDLFGEPR
jgi:prepilin-type N-terminal cleavage/methylation domain-containing protein